MDNRVKEILYAIAPMLTIELISLIVVIIAVVSG